MKFYAIRHDYDSNFNLLVIFNYFWKKESVSYIK